MSPPDRRTPSPANHQQKKCSARSWSVVKVKNYEKVSRSANAGNFGLSAGIVTPASSMRVTPSERLRRDGDDQPADSRRGYHVPFGEFRAAPPMAIASRFCGGGIFTQIKTAYSFS